MDAKQMLHGLAVPVLAAPLFLVSGPELVIAQSRAGVIGSFPALNARTDVELDDWLTDIRETLGSPDSPAGSTTRFAVNLIAHPSNDRFDQGLAAMVAHRVPYVIASLGGRPEIAEAIHSYGGVLIQDVATVRHAHKAVETGADVLLAIAAGAGGHTGAMSPFGLVAEIRRWFDGPLGVGGAISTGAGIVGALGMGADLAYIGSPFIATREATAVDAYKQMVVDEEMAGIVRSRAFTGLDANYLGASISANGLDPAEAAQSSRTGFTAAGAGDAKAWRDIWGAGHGIGAVDAIVSTRKLVERLRREQSEAIVALRARLDRL